MILSFPLSWIRGLTWPAYSVFYSSHDFAIFPPNFLRLSAFPQATIVTPALLPCTSYITVGIRVRSRTVWKPALRARPSPCGPRGRTSGFACAWLSFALPSQSWEKKISQGHTPWLQDYKVSNLFMVFFICWSILIISLKGHLVFPCACLGLPRLPSSQRSYCLLESWIPAHTWEVLVLRFLCFFVGRLQFLRDRWLLFL